MKRLASGLGLIVVAALTVACSGGGGGTVAPSGSVPPASEAPGDAIVIVAKDLAFSPTEITVPADEAFEIVLDNQDSAPHNIAVSDASGASVFKGEIVTNAKVTNPIPALAAGSYPFICEVHPEMKGTITAE